MKSPFEFPEASSDLFTVEDRLDSELISPFVFSNHGKRRFAQKRSRKEHQLDNLISELPEVTDMAGYSLLSKLFKFWMNKERSSNCLELSWNEIAQSDDFELLRDHAKIAKGALKFSLKNLPNTNRPNLLGIGLQSRKELNEKLGSLMRQRIDNSITTVIPIYKFRIDAYRDRINSAIVERLTKTQSVAKSEEEEAEYNELVQLAEGRSKSIKQLLPPIKSIQWKKHVYTINVSKLFAAMGRFWMHLDVLIEFNKSNNGQGRWKVVKLVYRITDSFDFNSKQRLGPWSEQGLTMPGSFLTNEILRDYGYRHSLKDFEVKSQKREKFESEVFMLDRKLSSKI